MARRTGQHLILLAVLEAGLISAEAQTIGVVPWSTPDNPPTQWGAIPPTGRR
jgi:hypothetical protein